MSANAIPITSFIDKSLKKGSKKSVADYYKELFLSIRVSLDGFSFSVYEPEKNKHLALVSYLLQEIEDYDVLCEELNDIFSKEELLQRYYPKVNVLFESAKSTLIPLPLFDPNELKTYLKFNHALHPKEEVHYDKLINLEACNVYAVPKVLKEKLRDKFAKYNISNFNSSLIEVLLINHKNQNLNNTVFVNIRNSSFDVIYIDGLKLVLINTFRYRTKEDFAYFLLFVLNQLKLNPEEVKIVFMGEIDKNSNLYEIAYKYIRYIEFIERNDYFKYSYVFDDVPTNHQYNLLNVNMCEL